MAPGKKVAKREDAKKSEPKGGIKKGSASKVMKEALGQNDRLSINAVTVSIRETEKCIASIAKACKAALDFGKKKTVTYAILTQVLETGHFRSTVIRAASLAQADSKLKGGRNQIANASVGRVFRQAIGKEYRMSALALDALSLIAEAELMRFASGGLAVAKVGGRTTVKERDIHAVIKLSHC